jgi:hypothetical protein
MAPFGQVYTSGVCVGHLRRLASGPSTHTVARYNYLSTVDRLECHYSHQVLDSSCRENTWNHLGESLDHGVGFNSGNEARCARASVLAQSGGFGS